VVDDVSDRTNQSGDRRSKRVVAGDQVNSARMVGQL
jgi:hypothetical protein